MSDEPRSLNFIEEIIEEHARTRAVWGAGADAVSAGAEWVFAHRACQEHLPEFRAGDEIQRHVQSCGSTIRTRPRKKRSTFKSIEEDVRWLGFDVPPPLYASDYFEQIHAWAIELVKAGHAYVCDLNADQIREYRGTLTTPGKNSPFRDRPVAENLDLFERMRKGEFPEGSRTLRAKVDMAHPNLEHARSGDVSDFVREASSHRRQVVHLSDVRLGARAERFDRECDAFDLHAGV